MYQLVGILITDCMLTHANAVPFFWAQTYLGIQIFRFHFKFTMCSAERSHSKQILRILIAQWNWGLVAVLNIGMNRMR